MKKVLIEIPDEEIYLYMSYGGTNGQRLMGYIAEGKFLPDNATNGDVIKMMFPTVDISTNGKLGKEGTVFVHHKDHIIIFDLDWWNAPYREDGEPE